MYFYWNMLLRYGDNLNAVSEKFETQVKREPDPTDASTYDDWRTVVTNVRLHIHWRRVIETGEMTSRELLRASENAFGDFRESPNAGFHHRATMTLHRARAYCLIAIEDPSDRRAVDRAFAELRSTERYATNAGFRVVEMDTLIVRFHLLSHLVRNNEATELRKRIQRLLDESNYDWGRRDLDCRWKLRCNTTK